MLLRESFEASARINILSAFYFFGTEIQNSALDYQLCSRAALFRTISYIICFLYFVIDRSKLYFVGILIWTRHCELHWVDLKLLAETLSSWEPPLIKPIQKLRIFPCVCRDQISQRWVGCVILVSTWFVVRKLNFIIWF